MCTLTPFLISLILPFGRVFVVPNTPTVTIPSASVDSLTVSINGGAGRRDYYQVRYTITGGATVSENVTGSAQTATHSIGQLSAGSVYDVVVYAFSGDQQASSDSIRDNTG